MTEFPRITPFGESALLVELGATIDPALNARVHVLADRLDQGVDGLPGLGRCVPAYASLLVPFEPGSVDVSDLVERLGELATRAEGEAVSGSLVEIAVMYGYDHGPDLEEVARLAGLSAGAVGDPPVAAESRGGGGGVARGVA